MPNKRFPQANKISHSALLLQGQSNVYKGFSEASGVSGNVKDILFETTYFKDFVVAKPGEGEDALPIMVENFARQQATLEEATLPFSRVEKVEVFALPRFSNGDNANTTYAVLFGVKGVGKQSNVSELAAVHNTVVNPTANVKWVRVGGYNCNSLFGNSVLLPNTEANHQELFRLSVVNSDTGESEFALPIQLMIKVWYSQVLPPHMTTRVGTQYAKEWLSPTTPPVEDHYALVEPQRMRNTT